MKRIVTVLMLSAIPAMAAAQEVSCNDCDHIAPYFRGEGGFIGSLANGVDEVAFVASCGSVTITGEAQVHGDTASQLFNHRNGLACELEGGSLQIAGLKDGGWYWITDDTNSAVGNLVAKDILENETTDITSAGDGVTMTVVKGAVYLKEVATGRVGILPNILPEMTMDPPEATKCGFKGSATAASPASPVQTECALGDGGTTLLMTSQNAITGATVRIMDKGSITRPGGSGHVEIVADLWGNGSGHYVTTHDAATANGISAMRGQPAVAMSAARTVTRLTGVTYGVSLSTGGPGAGATIASGGDGSGDAGGVSWTEANSAATVSVGAASSFCSKDNNHTATVMVTAQMDTATDADQVVPSVVRSTTSTPAGRVGSASFMITCPAASASQGQE